MSKKIKTSVIVCAFNEEKRLAGCLDSIYIQIKDVEGIELLIIDNESSDDTGIIAKEFVNNTSSQINVRYIRIQHVDLTISRNTGVKQSQGEFVVFIDADAKADKNWLSELMSGFDDDVDIVSGRIDNLNHESMFSRFIYNAHFKASVSGRDSKLIGANMAIRRKVFDSVGGFMQQVKGRGDEISLATKYFTLFPMRKQNHVDSSIVYNEHPEQLKVWLKQQYNEGKSYITIQRLTNRLNFKEHIKNTLRFLNIGFWFSVIPFMFFESTYVETFFLVGMLIRNGYRYEYIWNSLKKVYSDVGRIYSLFVIPNILVGTFCLDVGCWVELLFGRKRFDTTQFVTSKIIDSL